MSLCDKKIKFRFDYVLTLSQQNTVGKTEANLELGNDIVAEIKHLILPAALYRYKSLLITGTGRQAGGQIIVEMNRQAGS